MNIAQTLYDIFSRSLTDKRLVVFVFAFLPIVELRGAIPLAVAIGLDPLRAWLYSLLGSFAACPVTLGFCDPLLGLLKRNRFFSSASTRFETAVTQKAIRLNQRASVNKRKTGRSDRTALIKVLTAALFVALPLPMTGVWTGTCVARCMGLNNAAVLVAIALGDMIAATIVALSVVVFADSLNVILMVVAGLCLGGIFVWLAKTMASLLKRRSPKCKTKEKKE